MYKISVIIPAYNVEKHIERCLQSVINQTLKDIEIIIINDGSTDNTLENIKKVIDENDKRIKIISRINKGVSYSRNEGIELATGEYIAFLDADDWIEANFCEDVYLKLKQTNSDIITCDYYINESQIVKRPEFEIINNKEYLKEILNGNIMPSVALKVIKRNILIQNNIKFNEKIKIGEDLLFSFDLSFLHIKVTNIKKPYYHYMIRENSASNSYNKNILDILNVIRYIEDKLRSHNLYNKFKDEVNYLKYIHLYYLYIIIPKPFNKTHKLLYKAIKNIDINIDNIYKQNNLTKINYYAYKKSYLLGAIFYYIRQIIRIILNIKVNKIFGRFI